LFFRKLLFPIPDLPVNEPKELLKAVCQHHKNVTGKEGTIQDR